jgi:hypothetical protein
VFEEVGRWKQRETGADATVKFHHSDTTGDRPILSCNGQGSVLSEESVGGAYSTETLCSFSSVVPVFVIGNYNAVDKPAVNISYLSNHKAGADDYALAIEQVGPLISKWFGDHRDKPEYKAEVIDLPDP